MIEAATGVDNDLQHDREEALVIYGLHVDLRQAERENVAAIDGSLAAREAHPVEARDDLVP